MVPADRQSPGHETVWQPEGPSQGADTPEDIGTLGHSPMQFIQVREDQIN